MSSSSSPLSVDKIVLHARPASRAAAIDQVGALLVAKGHVQPGYVRAMHEREALATTYVGNGVAVPHATREALSLVQTAGVAILHVPDGVDFGDGNIARLVVGIAARGDDHLQILTSLAEICSDDEQLARLLAAKSPAELLGLLQPGLSL